MGIPRAANAALDQEQDLIAVKVRASTSAPSA